MMSSSVMASSMARLTLPRRGLAGDELFISHPLFAVAQSQGNYSSNDAALLVHSVCVYDGEVDTVDAADCYESNLTVIAPSVLLCDEGPAEDFDGMFEVDAAAPEVQ